MGFFDRFKKQPQQERSDYEVTSQLGENPDAWDRLDTAALKQVLTMKCIEYGVSQDESRIPKLFALYRYAVQRLGKEERLELLTQFSTLTEERGGEGHMGLMMFMAGDHEASIVSTAALSLSVLFPPKDGNPLSGPEFVVRTLMRPGQDAGTQGAALGGVLLLGDKRLLPLLGAAWDKLSDEARLALSQSKSGFVAEAFVEFWIGCLEKGCSESVFGSVVAAIAKLPAIAQAPFVVDVERVFPAYADLENAMRMIRRTSFSDYLEEIRPRLEKLEAEESEPALIPHIYEIWENPDGFRGRIG